VTDAPLVTRVRHETRRRLLTVASVTRLAPSMVRVVLRGAELDGFISLGFDDHVKLFFPGQLGLGAEPEMRDFTPRHFDAGTGELWIDFFLHESGPAAAWAALAAPGQTLSIGGPRGSFILPLEGIDSHVLIGDETALPAIGRRLEELPADARAIVVVETGADAQAYPLSSRAPLQVEWVLRPPESAPNAGPLIDVLRTMPFEPGSWFTWIAAETHVAREIRRYLTSDRSLDKRRVKAAGYWRRGAVATHERISDEE